MTPTRNELSGQSRAKRAAITFSITLRSLTIDGDRFLVNLLSHAADDPAGCPSLGRIRTFRLREGLSVDKTTE